VAFPDVEHPTARRTRRDIAALALIVIGLGGLVAAAAMWDWRALLALASLFTIAAGVYLGMDR
jgi:hydrogenase/urease accessory protein HupE